MKIQSLMLMDPEEVAGSPPASTPSSEGTSPTTDSAPVDFSSIVDSGYGDEPEPAKPSPAPAPAPVASPPASTSPESGLPGQAQPQVQPAPAPVQQPVVSSPPAAPQPSAQGPFDLEALRNNTLPQLQELYALSEQDAVEFEASPAKALPKLAAKLHFEATMAAYGSVMNVLPQVVGSLVQQVLQAREQDKAFYDRWPQLRGKEETVMRTLQAWRQVNPQATQEELIERGGLMAMLALGINPQPPAPSPAPAAPTPHKPAGPAGVGAFNGVFSQSDNIFEQIAGEHLAEMGLPTKS